MPEPEFISELDAAASELLDVAAALNKARDAGDQAQIAAAGQELTRAQADYDQAWERDQAGDRRGTMGPMKEDRRRAVDEIHARRGQVLAEAAGRGWVHAIDPGCGLDWQGPARAWDAHLSDIHARAHRDGRDGLDATSRLSVERMATPAWVVADDREARALGQIAQARGRDLAAGREGAERARDTPPGPAWLPR